MECLGRVVRADDDAFGQLLPGLDGYGEVGFVGVGRESPLAVLKVPVEPA